MVKQFSFESVRSIKSLKGKRVLVRIDANVPLKHNMVADDSRLKAILPTIQYLQKKGAITILLSHLGRPEGKVNHDLSVKPVAERLQTLLQKPVVFIPTSWSFEKEEKQNIQRAVHHGHPGEIFFCENIRFSPLEEKKSRSFASFVASLGEVYVNDAFAVSHRSDMSVALLPEYLPAYAGLLLEKEIQGLDRLKQGKERPFVALVGGIKLETKIPLLTSLQKTSDAILLGGGLANTCLASLGYDVGQSIIDTTLSTVAQKIATHPRVVLPLDVVVGTKDGDRVRVVPVPSNPSVLAGQDEGIFDIGPKTIATFKVLLQEGKRIVWNGAMGYFEKEVYAKGTVTLAKVLGKKKRGRRYSVAGGGETIEAIGLAHAEHGFTLCSTGGGAMLAYIAGESLPGIEALRRKKTRKKK